MLSKIDDFLPKSAGVNQEQHINTVNTMYKLFFSFGSSTYESYFRYERIT